MANIASDGFTGADGTALTTYDANWIKVTGFTDTAQIQANRARGPNTRVTTACYRYNVAPPSADYEVAAEFFVADGSDTNANAGVVARAQSGSQTCYMARWRRGTGFQLFKFLGNATAVQVGATVAHTYASGATGKIRLRCNGSIITVYRGDEATPVISATDTSIAAAGFPGIWTNANSNTVGPQLDNWSADELSVTADVTLSVNGSAAVVWAGAGAMSVDISDPPAGAVTAGVSGSASVLWGGSASVSVNIDTGMVTENGIWTWFTEPRAVFYNGSYYVGWINNVGDAGITKVVSATGARSHFTLKVNLQLDDHNNAAIHIRPDGRIMCFYGRHNDSSGIRYRTSTNAEDISAWGAEQIHAPATLPTCYSNPRYLSAAGRLFYHYRTGTPPNAPHSIISTANNGTTWTPETQLFLTTGSARPYVKSTTNGVDRIDFVLTNCHPNEGNSSVYHCYGLWDSGTSALRYYTSAGVELTTPINPTSCTLIHDGSSQDGWNWDITYGSDGRPRVLYARFPSTTDHRYMFSRWDGSAWTTAAQVCAGGTYLYSAEPTYSGGMCFDGNDANVVYASRQVSGQWEIEEYQTSDNGATWVFERAITSGSTVKNARPYSPRGHDNNLGVLWWAGTYTTYVNYNTSIRSAEATTAVESVVVDVDVSASGAVLYSGTVSMSVDVIAMPPGAVTASVAALGSVVYSGTVSMSADVLPMLPGAVTASVSASGGVVYNGAVSMSATVLPMLPVVQSSIAAVGGVVYAGTVSMLVRDPPDFPESVMGGYLSRVSPERFISVVSP